MTPLPSDPAAKLRESRALIDSLDTKLVALLAERLRLGLAAAEAKAAMGLPVIDEMREAEVLRQADADARIAGLPPDRVLAIFRAIIDMTAEAQRNPA